MSLEKYSEKTTYKYKQQQGGNSVDFSNMDDTGFELLFQAICLKAKQDLIAALRAKESGKSIKEFFRRTIPDLADKIIAMCEEEARKSGLESKKEKIERVKELFAKGLTQTYIAEETGFTPHYVRKIGIKEGYIVPSEKKDGRKYTQPIAEEIIEEAKELLRKKLNGEILLSNAEICKQLGISATTLYRLKRGT